MVEGRDSLEDGSVIGLVVWWQGGRRKMAGNRKKKGCRLVCSVVMVSVVRFVLQSEVDLKKALCGWAVVGRERARRRGLCGRGSKSIYR